MGKIFLTIAFALLTLNWQNTTAIEGKWMVDKVDIGAMQQKLTPQQISTVNTLFVKPLTNGVFEFRADHHFYLTPGFPNMPKNDLWEYDAANKVITIKEISDTKGVVMKIEVITKNGVTYFGMAESPVILKVHKL